ncbi:CCN family member 2 [Aplysia californica]|uniref:CCN family member 2 n=1 Tax=Aplysia californica TaxID=6500 RepID=A0ABM1A753_APLCA|nr:CCN family member 2 [Aplysia californica]
MSPMTSQLQGGQRSGLGYSVISRLTLRHSTLTTMEVQQLLSSGLLFVTLTFLFLSGSAQADLHSPCLGCRLFNLQHRLHPEVNKTDTVFCHYPCQCPYEELSCHEGVTVVKDGCGCCYMCARQQGDICSVRDLCDVSKGLYCDRKDDKSVGHCQVKERRRSCNVGGVSYQDGEKFQPDCTQLCTCQNGFYGCVSTCPQEQHKPSELTCHEPKLIKVKNKCCREWTCQKMEADVNSRIASVEGLESQNLVLLNPLWYQSTTTSPAPEPTTPPLPEPCHTQSTDWSPCSVSCDVGVAVRIVVDSVTCMHVQERKLCYLRPCGLNLTTHGRDKCTPTTRTKSREHIQHQDCLSVREYKLKFCTTCREDACCYPKKTRTSTMEFQCSGGVRKTFNYMWIKKCRCDQVCYKKGPNKKRRMRRRRFRNREKRRRLRGKDKKKRNKSFSRRRAMRRRARRRMRKMQREE